jgi:hypothetical protein
MADQGACHRCGTERPLWTFPFGLARILDKKRDWSEAALSIGVSLITVPLFGMGRLSGPAKTLTGNVLRLELLLCAICRDAKKNIFGVVRLTQDDYALHPLWGDAHRSGFTHFIPGTKLDQWTSVESTSPQ